MEFDFIIEYKQGNENQAADAFSRVECATISIHQPDSDLLERIKASWQGDDALQKLIAEVTKDPSSHKDYSLSGGELRRKQLGGNLLHVVEKWFSGLPWLP